MVHFCYCGEYRDILPDVPNELWTYGREPNAFHLGVIEAAHFFKMPPLVDLAMRKISFILSHKVFSCEELLQLLEWVLRRREKKVKPWQRVLELLLDRAAAKEEKFSHLGTIKDQYSRRILKCVPKYHDTFSKRWDEARQRHSQQESYRPR